MQTSGAVVEWVDPEITSTVDPNEVLAHELDVVSQALDNARAALGTAHRVLSTLLQMTPAQRSSTVVTGLLVRALAELNVENS